ncbi:hypothetical protein BHE74_00038399 [Ensete ventricosum]|nr:hypothetical protein GW17_00049469 [Ensete ventricosum]RWW54985.1 hypothetical protein BHE74_00038399 [Ensete ventricosum]
MAWEIVRPWLDHVVAHKFSETEEVGLRLIVVAPRSKGGGLLRAPIVAGLAPWRWALAPWSRGGPVVVDAVVGRRPPFLYSVGRRRRKQRHAVGGGTTVAWASRKRRHRRWVTRQKWRDARGVQGRNGEWRPRG